MLNCPFRSTTVCVGNGIVDDCDEDLIPPVIFISEGVTLEELEGHDGKAFVTSHCFDLPADVAIFLETHVYAKDDCAKDLDISINEVAIQASHSWEQNHNYTLAEYLVSVTDRRCPGLQWSANKTYLVPLFDQYDEDVQLQGCNGFDENCDGRVDDCSEDRTPPVISFKESFNELAYERDDGIIVIREPAFDSLERARKWLNSVIQAEDDCARDLHIAVAKPPASNCASTVFTVTVTDPRCSPTNEIQTVVQLYELWVDVRSPTVEITLGRDAPKTNRLLGGDGSYIHIDQDLHDYQDIEFSYTIEVSS